MLSSARCNRLNGSQAATWSGVSLGGSVSSSLGSTNRFFASFGFGMRFPAGTDPTSSSLSSSSKLYGCCEESGRPGRRWVANGRLIITWFEKILFGLHIDGFVTCDRIRRAEGGGGRRWGVASFDGLGLGVWPLGVRWIGALRNMCLKARVRRRRSGDETTGKTLMLQLGLKSLWLILIMIK